MINHLLPTWQPQHEFPVYVCATICCSWHCAIESTACSHVINKELRVPVGLIYNSRHQDFYVLLHVVLLNQIKSNHFYCHITTAQVPWWVKFLWACSRQCKKNNNNNLHMDRQCKKTTTTIYIWTDSAKKQQQQFTYGQTVQKNNNLHMDRQCKKNNKQFTYGQTVQKNCTGAFTVLQTVQKNNNNLHMDSTYLQTIQKTMCKIHIHILSTHSVL